MQYVRMVLMVTVAGLLTSADVWAETAVEKAIATEIAKNLKESGQMRDYKIGIKMKGGTAWLVGQVTGEDQARTALDIARHSDGVQRVINKLSTADGDEANPLRDEARDPRVSQAQHAIEAGGRRPDASQPGPALAGPGRMGPSRARAGRSTMPLAFAPARATGGRPRAVRNVQAGYPGANGFAMPQAAGPGVGMPIPSSYPQGGVTRTRHDQPVMPGYAWPSYASHPNYAALTYPKQYSPTAWPFIGPFYPYPQVPLGWRKVTLEWDDGWWFLDFQDH